MKLIDLLNLFSMFIQHLLHRSLLFLLILLYLVLQVLVSLHQLLILSLKKIDSIVQDDQFCGLPGLCRNEPSLEIKDFVLQRLPLVFEQVLVDAHCEVLSARPHPCMVQSAQIDSLPY